MKKILVFGMLMVLALSLAACGGETASTGSTGSTAASTLTVDTATAGTLAYAQTNLEAKAGDVTVTFNNKGALEHNWVVVKPGDEQKAVDEALTKAPTFLPTNAVAMGKTIAGGQSETITAKFEPGTYSYICTYPGHYAAGMKGTLVVK